MDLARANAVRRAKEEAKWPVQEAWSLERGAFDESHWKRRRNSIEAAKTADEEWLARWKLFYDMLINKRLTWNSKRRRRTQTGFVQEEYARDLKIYPYGSWNSLQLTVRERKADVCNCYGA